MSIVKEDDYGDWLMEQQRDKRADEAEGSNVSRSKREGQMFHNEERKP